MFITFFYLIYKIEYVPQKDSRGENLEPQHDGTQGNDVVNTANKRSLTREEMARRLVLALEAVIVIVQIVIMVVDWW